MKKTLVRLAVGVLGTALGLTVAAPRAESAAPDYRAAAEGASAYIQRTFWDEREGLYHPASPPEPGKLPYDFMWANGVQLPALNAATQHDPKTYRPILDRFFRGLDRYWDRRAPIPAYDAYFSQPGHSDKYYDDNEWMVIALVDSYRVTKDVRYLDRADAALRYVLSGWDEQLGGGIYWKQDHKSKNTCSNGPAAEAALAMSRYRRRDENVAWAEKIVRWTEKNLEAPDGTFWDNEKLDGRIERSRWTYNTALMLRSNLDLYRATHRKEYLEEAQREAQACEKEFVNPATGAFKDNGLFSHLLVEAFLDLYRETHEPYLLDRARKNADFVLHDLRDPADGGFWEQWKIVPERKEPRKLLMASASAARLLWLVSEFDHQ